MGRSKSVGKASADKSDASNLVVTSSVQEEVKELFGDLAEQPRGLDPVLDSVEMLRNRINTVCGKKNREKTFARSFFKVFWPCGRPHAQNKKSGTSRSLCCQIFSSVRRLELKKTKKKKNSGNRQRMRTNQ